MEALDGGLIGLFVAMGMALVEVVKYFLRQRRNGAGDDRGTIVKSLAAMHTVNRDILEELRGLRRDMSRQGAEIHDLRTSLVKLQENQAVLMALTQKHNGAA